MEVTQSETAVWLPTSIMVTGAAEGAAAQDAGGRKPSGTASIDDVQARATEKQGPKPSSSSEYLTLNQRFGLLLANKVNTKLPTILIIQVS